MAESEPVDGLSSGLRALVARDYLASEKFMEQQWRANRRGADPRILLFEKVFQSRMHKLGVPMFAHTMVRTAAEQQADYVRGVTNAKPGESPHEFGCAVDLVHCLMAWGLADESWRMLGHIGKEVAAQNGLKVTWGGEFKSLWDPAHWELTGWRNFAIAAPVTSDGRG